MDIWIMSHQLHQTLKAAIPLAQALSLVHKQCSHAVKPMLRHSLMMVKQGLTFSSSLKEFESDLPHSYLAFIESGEAIGNLPNALDQANQLILQTIQLRRLFKKALTYPFMIIIVSLLILLGMVNFIIPQFEQMYHQMNSQLPMMTHIVLSIFQHLQSNAPWFALGLFLSISAIMALVKNNTKATLIFQQYLLKIPKLGLYLTHKEYIQWLSLMGAFLQSGITLNKAMIMSTKALSLTYFNYPMKQIIEWVEEGHLLSQSLLKKNWMHEEDLTFIRIGESNGELGKSMAQQADLLQNQMKEKIEALTRLLEPLILVILALVMGTLLIALYLPLFQMGQLF
jgi:type II secretory pathway component PulF